MKISIAQANAIATGDYSQTVELLSDQDQLGRALAEMTDTLRATTAKNTKQDWLKSGQAQLNELMSGEQNIKQLAKQVITFLTTNTEASIGLFYILQESEPENYLHLIASYAYTANDNIPDKFLLGEGLVGQAALEQQTIFRIHEPDEYTHIIQSGLAKAVPHYVIILPFLYEKTVKGVIEIGATKILTETQREFLEQIMPNIGIAVNTAASCTKMQALLEQSQRQAEELQRKQTEMQQTNEELQSQSEELQSQSEKLQTQQEELRQTNEALEERTRGLEQQKTAVQEKNRTLEVNRIEMEKAQAAIVLKAQELELASKYKSEFLANMSHELRTPLNSLLILAQLLADNKQSNLTDKQVEYAKTVYSAGNDLLVLINDILDLSKVEAGKIEVQWEDVLLSDLLTMVEQKFRHVAEDKGLAFHLTIADNIPSTLSTDGQRLKQIINNLLSNAFKFTSTGEVKVIAQCPANIPLLSELGGNVLEATQTIAISVIDSGIGIPKDKQQVIFEAFQQVDGTTSRSYGGTGLGLSISRQLARLLGGELILDCSESKGSTFTLYLPINRLNSQSNDDQLSLKPSSVYQANQTIQTAPQELISPKEPIVDDRNDLQPSDKSILIIEDDQKFSNIVVELARSKGFKCLIAEDGISGLQLAEEYKPHAIILDIGLPELDGWTVMEKLKDNPNTRHIPVHFMSAAEQQQNMDAQRMGAIGYLLKPVSMEQLGEAFQKIEQFLTTTVKNLLVISNIESHQQKILELVEGENIQSQLTATISNVCQQLQTTAYDCIILDIDIENGSGCKLLEQMQQEKTCQTPIIVYADRDLTPNEEALLLRCADELPIKSVQSPERLLDEATLFLHQVEANLPTEKRKMLRMVHDKTAILRQKKVLIVDDDVRNVFALATVLEDHDMEVVIGINGKEGLAMLNENNDIAIVLMDIMMPEMDGYEAMQKIREQPCYRQLPIIALTAKAMKGDKTKCIEAGANDYLAKPVETDKLLSLMRVWLYR
jgi:signal transduction histidine kinase/DNA-binding response OmpR family regulator